MGKTHDLGKKVMSARARVQDVFSSGFIIGGLSYEHFDNVT